MDVHKAKGLRVQRAVQAAARKMGEPVIAEMMAGLADAVACDERAAAARRRARAKKHARNLDLFDDRDPIHETPDAEE